MRLWTSVSRSVQRRVEPAPWSAQGVFTAAGISENLGIADRHIDSRGGNGQFSDFLFAAFSTVSEQGLLTSFHFILLRQTLL